MSRLNYFLPLVLTAKCAGKIGDEHVSLLPIIDVMSHLPLPWLQRYKPLVKSPLMQYNNRKEVSMVEYKVYLIRSNRSCHRNNLKTLEKKRRKKE